MQKLRLPSEIWNNYIFQKFLSYTDILNLMSIHDTRLNKKFIEYAFDEYHSQYIDIMILYIRNLLLQHNKNNIFRLILDDKLILLSILRYTTNDLLNRVKYDIDIYHFYIPYNFSCIRNSGVRFIFEPKINGLELRCINNNTQQFQGVYYGYKESKWYKERETIKVFHVKNNYWYSIIKWDKDDIKSEEYIYN